MSRDVEFSNQVTVRRTPADVFAFLSDFTQLPRWNYAITSTRQVTPGPVGLGSEFRQVRSIPTTSEESFEVTAWDPVRRLAITGDFGPFSGTLSYELEAVTGGTTLVNHVRLSPHGVLGLAAGLAGSRLKAAVAENLEVLRRGLENGF
ncbi:MAG TPA: SRPBCC family protein [Nocardioides sp.]|uniref:SRPBCC family protein n=1 Tax=Nocardioides sp. TaxID=35761 RepID=UPI002E3017D6|nr:SRPBCC family protein [Nocardioides sp.]HEX5088689.1 SRPBCC family protein [Nocardioides sp.]